MAAMLIYELEVAVAPLELFHPWIQKFKSACTSRLTVGF
jgi:hypothetical protein